MRTVRARTALVSLAVILALVGSAMARVYCCGLANDLRALAATSGKAPCPEHLKLAKSGKTDPSGPQQKKTGTDCPACFAFSARAAAPAQDLQLLRAPIRREVRAGAQPAQAAAPPPAVRTGTVGSRAPPRPETTA